MSDAISSASFPPLFEGLEVAGSIDPFEKACSQAALGCDAGLIAYNIAADRLSAAIVFAPEVELADAVAMLPVCGIGFQNALGALAPPEVSVHLDWSGGIYVNGAACGELKIAASTNDEKAVPDWLVVGLLIPLMLPASAAPGEDPRRTCLFEEGCAEISPVGLLESWSRHSLVWINRWSEGGLEAVHAEWRGLARGLGEDIAMEWHGEHLEGKFLGVDEQFNMILRTGARTRLLKLCGALKGGTLN
ncbi:MAG: DUF4444 domain-containing protein [Albidovulum sp.]|nr:DUF4444 domain-containing protein [Albidovulum sp.]MDE0533119.1 DUF4444 domain-containing protein [Albidovulum sp.]